MQAHDIGAKTMTEKQVKELQGTLKQQLESLGLSKSLHESGRQAYTALKGVRRVKADYKNWLVIGKVVDTIKNHLAEKKVNVNSGKFQAYCKTFFPEVTRNELSACKWVFQNQFEISIWREKNNSMVANPEAIRRAIRKSLKDSKAEDSEYKKFALNPPAASKASTSGNSQMSTIPAAKTEEGNISAKSMDRMKNAELLAFVKLAITKIDVSSINVNDSKDIDSIINTLSEYRRVKTIERNTKAQVEKSASK